MKWRRNINEQREAKWNGNWGREPGGVLSGLADDGWLCVVVRVEGGSAGGAEPGKESTRTAQ